MPTETNSVELTGDITIVVEYVFDTYQTGPHWQRRNVRAKATCSLRDVVSGNTGTP